MASSNESPTPREKSLEDLDRELGAAFSDPARFSEAIDLKQTIAFREAPTLASAPAASVLAAWQHPDYPA